MNIANNKIRLKDQTTYSRMTTAKAVEVSKDITDIIETVKPDIQSVGFTTDLWTSRAGHSYLSLTTHFIDKSWKLHRYTPYIKPFPGRHTGVNIALKLDSMIDTLGLKKDDISLYAVNDNAANMKLGIRLSDNLIQYCCDIHTLQLAVDGTFREVIGMENVLKKCKALATFTHQSTVALDALEKAARDENIPFRKLKNPGDTRWDSRYDTMISELHLKDVIKKLCDENEDWSDKIIDRAGWKLLEGAVKILKPIKDTVKAFKGEKEPTMQRVLERIYTNHYLLDKFINNHNNCHYGIGFARTLKMNIEHRFPNKGLEVEERRFANYLAPQFKGIHLLSSNRLENTKDELEATSDRLESVEEVESEEDDELQDVELSPTSKLMRQCKDRFDVANRRNKSKLRIEMEKYELFSLQSKDCDILLWWKQHDNVLPLLSKIAKRVLTIPASSAKSERVFSTGGNVVTAKRNRLAPKKVEALVLIKENKDKVDAFKRNLDYVIAKTDKNTFENINHVRSAAPTVGSLVLSDDEEDD